MKSTRLLIATACLCAASCGPSEPSSQPSAAGTSGVNAGAAADTASQPSEDPEVTLEIKSWDQTQEYVAAQQGKVVVLDLWSTWCGPCKREFPNLVELHQAHPGQVACVSFAMDYEGLPDEPVESFRENVLKFLDEQQATLTNILSSDPSDEVFRQLELGSIPAVLVYGRDGQLARRFDNDENLYGAEGFTYEDHIVPLVDELLAGIE